MTTISRSVAVFLTAFVLAVSGPAMAQHSDVEVSVENSQLVIENGLLMSNGGVLFEAEFGELADPFATDEPGFEVDDGLFNAGEILAFQAVGSLQYWDGSAWTSAAVPDSMQIAATDVLGLDSVWDANGVSNPVGLVGEADDEGGVHSHIDFGIAHTGGGAPVIGAYLVEFALFGLAADQTTQVYGATSSMFVAFNLGLGEDAFEAAVDTLLAAPVPVPGAAVLLFSGLVSLFGMRRRNAA